MRDSYDYSDQLKNGEGAVLLWHMKKALTADAHSRVISEMSNYRSVRLLYLLVALLTFMHPVHYHVEVGGCVPLAQLVQ